MEHRAGTACYLQMMRTLAVLIVLTLARTVYAGACFEVEDAMKKIEAFAKNGSKANAKAIEETEGWFCLEFNAPAFKPQIERACRTILDRDDIKSPCAYLAAAAGLAKLGDHDLFATVIESPDDPLAYQGNAGAFGATKTQVLGRMGDPRAASVIVQLWKTALPRAEQQAKRRHAMMSWSVWRQDAAASLGAVGGKDEIAFLDEQAKATKDKFVAKACRSAVAVIEKRLAPPAPKQP
jgi:hypothetical protein